MATTMTEIPIKDLALTTAPAGKQLLVRDASAGLQRIDYDQIAKNLVESYGSSSLAGKNQSIKAAIDSLNSGLTQNTNSISTINDSLLNINKGHKVFYTRIANSRFQRVGSIVICTSDAYHTVNEIKSIPYGYRPIHSLYIPIFIDHSSRITLLFIKDNGSLNIWDSGVMNGNTLFCQDGAQITVDNYPS